MFSLFVFCSFQFSSRFDSNPIKMCTYNAEIAAKAGKKDHLNTWSVCKLISDPNLNQNTDDCSLMEFPW